MPKKLTIEFIEKDFKKENYKLLINEYKNNYSKLKYICPNEHEHEIRWGDWQQGKRCVYCAGQGKPTIEFIRAEFEKDNYVLLASKYKNNYSKLKYICSKGHEHSIAWNNWQQGQRCPHCAGLAKKTIEFIKKEFKKENYILLTNEYENSHAKLKYICPEGHTHTIRWYNWQQGQRCPTCYNINNFGEKHAKWRGGISCEPYCFEWSSKEFKDYIKERDEYKCLNPDCWKTSKRLTIHHIDYNKKNCEPENLITLCASCNSRANKDRKWHKDWYQMILYRRRNNYGN